MPIFLPFFFGVGLLFIVLTHVALSLGVIQTATIDYDQSGVVYSPSDRFSLNSDCAECSVHPDANQAVDGTWHDSSQFRGQGPVSVTLSFTGTGIDVFCILANTLPNTVTTTYLAFTLDGSSYPSFTHNPDSSTSDYLYKQNVLTISGLAQVPHTLAISTNPPPDSGSLLLFDSAKYTFDDGTTPPPPPPPPTKPPITTTAQVTNVVTTTAITQITTTGAQKALSTLTISGAIITVGGSTFTQSLQPTASTRSAGTASHAFESSSTSSILNISELPSGSPIPSSSSSSSSSFTPSTASSSTKFKYGAVLAGIITPVVLIALAGTIFYRRRRTQRGIRDSESQGGQSSAPMIESQRSRGYNWEGSAPSMISALGSRRTTLNPVDNVESELGRDDEKSSDRTSSGARTYHSSSSPPSNQYPLSRSPPPPGYEPRKLPSIPL
ncbi:hypothetical protein DFH09DRAFT_1121388 [Mycena vulgaris]|nr:hypothetical protein DFH09DRAFT_1121388 [Mycena vulgaris]